MNRSYIPLVFCLIFTNLAFGQESSFSNYIELRTYVLHPGKQDAALNHFETHYLESQEQYGMRIWGQFKDLGNDRHFVWVRGFESMDNRASALLGFYTSELWQTTSQPILDMMAERATNVHFMEAVDQQSHFPAIAERQNMPVSHMGILAVQLYAAGSHPEEVISTIKENLIPSTRPSGGFSLGLFRTSKETNNFPALKIIEDADVIAWFTSFPAEKDFQVFQSHDKSGLKPFRVIVLEPGKHSRLFHRKSKD